MDDIGVKALIDQAHSFTLGQFGTEKWFACYEEPGRLNSFSWGPFDTEKDAAAWLGQFVLGWAPGYASDTLWPRPEQNRFPLDDTQ